MLSSCLTALLLETLLGDWTDSDVTEEYGLESSSLESCGSLQTEVIGLSIKMFSTSTRNIMLSTFLHRQDVIRPLSIRFSLKKV